MQSRTHWPQNIMKNMSHKITNINICKPYKNTYFRKSSRSFHPNILYYHSVWQKTLISFVSFQASQIYLHIVLICHQRVHIPNLYGLLTKFYSLCIFRFPYPELKWRKNVYKGKPNLTHNIQAPTKISLERFSILPSPKSAKTLSKSFWLLQKSMHPLAGCHTGSQSAGHTRSLPPNHTHNNTTAKSNTPSSATSLDLPREANGGGVWCGGGGGGFSSTWSCESNTGEISPTVLIRILQ